MPAKAKEKQGSPSDERSGANVRRTREPRRSGFSSRALHRQFENHVTAAQNYFLKGDATAAEKEATLALRIRPTAHLFALLAVIAESKGMFDRASDFRLLQAFLARDIVLWEELLHEFMSKQLYFKSVVCLQRMSALVQDKTRYRVLQLQLADLLIGLGEIRRASNVLVPLWNSSRCRDFEVFALLSSLYFQLGKWASLQRLIESSVKYAFQAPSGTAGEAPLAQGSEAAPATAPDANASPSVDNPSASQAAAAASPRVSKRVRFFGVDEDADESNLVQNEASSFSLAQPSSPSTPLDEFSFDDVLSPSSPGSAALNDSSQLGGSSGATSQMSPSPGGVIHQLYGERIELRTDKSRKDFLTLLNVHAELLNEQGSFSETVQLLHMAAGCLEVDVMDLPPDLLVRLGVAYAFLGGVWEQPCRDVFQHLVEHCSMEDYGDVLLDAAVSLQKVSMHAEAAQLYTSLARYHQFAYDRLHRQVGMSEMELALMEGSAPLEQVQAATAALDELRAEENDIKTVLAAANLGEAQCAYAREMYEEARVYAEHVLELDPGHLQARLLLGRYHFYHRKDTAAAVAVLTPRPNEPALQRIQLGAFLVQVFQSAKRYVEAIALGVSIFEVLLSSEEDGDTQSVAPGTSSRRSAASLYLPTMTRASSAIIPAASLAGMVGAGAGSSVTARTSFSLAASIRASSSVARQQLSRRGLESLTTTVYGASAAASIAAGWDKKEAEDRLKDTSTIFQFNRRRRRSATNEADGGADKASADADGDASPASGEAQSSAAGEASVKTEEVNEEPVSAVPRTAEERREAVLSMAPSAFWVSETKDGGPGEETDDADAKANEEASAEEAEGSQSPQAERTTSVGGSAAVKQEPTDANEEVAEVPKRQDAAKRPRAGQKAEAAESRKKRAKKEGEDGAERALPSNYTTLKEKERDLVELEEFLTQAEQMAADAESRKAEGNESSAVRNDGDEQDDATREDESGIDDELPSLEEVSKHFDDPAMAQLFLDASSFAPGGGVRGGEGRDEAYDPWSALAEANDATAMSPPLPGGAGPGDKVTLREAMEALGKGGFIALAVAVVDCYSAVGKFTEARDFAFVALTRFQQKRRLRRLGSRIERPLRLAVLRAALAAGDSEDAYRVGLRLLQEDTGEEKRHEVVELMHSVLNRCEDRSSILYRAVADGYGDPALLVLLGNRYHQTRSYTRVLNLYLMALRERPSDIFLNFMVGLAYLFSSHQKRSHSREACVSAAIYYLSRYQQLRLSLEPTAAVGEVLYNIARAMQFLKLYYLCIPLYERVAYDLLVPGECTVALQRAARMNLYYLYRWGAGNRNLALTALQPRSPDASRSSTARMPSPFKN